MAAQQKVLRIGVIRNGKIVEERILPARQPVTLGTGSRNTVVVAGAALPVSVPLFDWRSDRYLLAFGPDAQGRIEGPQGSADLTALVAQGLAAKQGGGYLVPIREDQRGKLVLGEVSILWQFVTPAPETPQPAIQSFSKGSHFQSMDRLFVTVLVLSLALHFVFTVWMLAKKVEVREVTLEEIPDRYARMFIPERKIEPPKVADKQPDAAGEAKVVENTEAKKEPEKKRGDPGTDSPEKKAARAAAVAKAVQSKGILKVLGSLGPGATGRTAVADVFGKGGGNGTVAEALAGAGGVAIATSETAGVGQRKGGGQGGAAGIGDLATSGGGGSKVGYGAKAEAKVTGSVAQEAAEVDSSDIDQAKLGAFVRARRGAVIACYENMLKRNPSLKGRLRVRFTILETGSVQDVTAVENSLGPEVAACVINIMRGWRTPFRPAGGGTVEIPFNFAPGG
jgi:outer membrane biosynthesis protein TonB